MFDYLVMDIGSTFTKQRLFKDYKLSATAQYPTTIENIYEGIHEGRKLLNDSLNCSQIQANSILSTSSAAGGLRMVAMGYMTRVTAKAAKEVAMNAGAKILEVISHENLPEYRIEILKEINPDIILLAGGTDSGDETSLIENANLIVKSKIKGIVVIAGNINAQEKAAQILDEGNVDYIRVPNIMPTIHELRVTEARESIHKEFIRQITKAKGSEKLKAELTNKKIVPTPGAVLLGAELAAKGTYDMEGLGGVLVIDLGGATTDIHSILPNLKDLSEEEKGLVVTNEKQESYRTVEGNLGLRVSAQGVLESIGTKAILRKKNITDEEIIEKFEDYVVKVNKETKHIPQNEMEEEFDELLAETAIEVALKRHAGYLAQEVDPVMGITPGMPIGRDLRKVKNIICVGGFFRHKIPEISKKIISRILSNRGISLLPEPSAQILNDKDYLLFATGIISQVDPDYAFKILKNHFKTI